MTRLRFSFAILLIGFCRLASANEANSVFPLGKVPAGWTYKKLPEMVRRFEAFPFEVTGVLTRDLGDDRSVSIFVVMKPVERTDALKQARSPASLWRWVDQTFVRTGLTSPKLYEINLQKKVGPLQAWTFREATIMQAGQPTQLASFYTKNNYHHVYLVLREEQRDYNIRLGQLKDLVSDLRLD